MTDLEKPIMTNLDVYPDCLGESVMICGHHGEAWENFKKDPDKLERHHRSIMTEMMVSEANYTKMAKFVRFVNYVSSSKYFVCCTENEEFACDVHSDGINM